MLLRLLTILLLLSNSVFALDHLFATRAGVGLSGLVGSEVPEGTKKGFAWSVGAIGAQSFYDNGPLWGTELSFAMHNIQLDTVLWNENTGLYNDTASSDLYFGRLSLGLFLMKSWDVGVNVSAGPQVSYLASCTKTVDGESSACDDDYRVFQLDAQMAITVFIVEPLAIDFKYVQTLLPFDRNGKVNALNAFASIGLLYVF